MSNKRYFCGIIKMMLCVGIVFTFHFSLFTSAHAQKYACVNTDYVLKSLPDYATAQKRLDKYVADWQKELQDKHAELDVMRAEYEQESYLLPENLKRRRMEEIREKEQEIKNLQQQRFGANGDLDTKRAELLKPVQDRVFATIERVAHEKNYAFVFDKSAGSTLLFVNKKYDISDEVLELLGFKPGATKEPAGANANDKKPNKPINPEMRSPNGKGGKQDRPLPLGGVGPIK